MTLNFISRKLFRTNLRHYALFFFSIAFSVSMTGAYGILQYSPSVTNVLADGGSTQTISQGMFYGSMLGNLIFLIYANRLFLKYKSRELGIFLSLGIKRSSVKKILVHEYTLLFLLASIAGFLLSLPIAFLSWSLLNVFLRTSETAFQIGWHGWLITLGFSLIAWFILRTVNGRFINTIDILHILKIPEQNESAKKGSIFKLVLSCFLIPAGIFLFFTLESQDGILYTMLAFAGMAVSLFGIYLFVLESASIGDSYKRFRKSHYYKHIVYYCLLKQKIHQYTRSIFVASLLITFTIFGIGFIAAGFIEGYNVAMNEPYDYTFNITADHPGMSLHQLYETAEKCNTMITRLNQIDGLLVGVQNQYKDGSTDWASRILISQSDFNAISGLNVSVEKDCYRLYYNSSMSYKKNALSSDHSLFYNPTTKQEKDMKQMEPVCADGIFNTRSFYSSMILLNDSDFQELSKSLGNAYKFRSYMMNVVNWRATSAFQDALLNAATSRPIFANWHLSAVFDQTGSSPLYLPYSGNETRIARVWTLYPLSKLSSATTQFESFATYLMLMLFIALVAFVSSIMVVGLKLASTIWDDSTVYEQLHFLGMTQHGIKKLVTRQMRFIFFIPAILGCLTGAFTTYRILAAAKIVYIAKTMELVLAVCLLVVFLQLCIFTILRSRILRHL